MQEREPASGVQDWQSPSEPAGAWVDAEAGFDSVDQWDDDALQEAVSKRPRRRARPETFGRATAQGIMAIVAIFAFIALALVWSRGTETRSQVTALAALVMVLATILLVEILLTRSIFDGLFRGTPSGLEITPDEDNFIVGCPGCGTVFTLTANAMEAGNFSCQNCGRPGFVKDYSLNTKGIEKEVCRTCGNSYLEYRTDSECPVCHTYNPY